MESNRRRRRRRRDNKPKAPKPKQTVESSSSPIARGATSTVHDVPDHVLEVIFLGLDSYVSLVRAASACKRWCRVVADAGFLRRFHPVPPAAAPLILGHYHHANHKHPVFVPSSTPSIRERSRGQSFSLDFVPKLGGARSWEIADSRDTLLLLCKSKLWTKRSSSSFNNPDLVVCRPLTRRYQPISLPDRLLTCCECLGFFLVDGGRSRLSDVKVIAVLLRNHMLDPGRGVPVACVYDGRWGWRDVSCTWSGGDINIPNTAGSICFVGRANGCLYWAIQGARTALVLDEATTGVSLVDLPPAAAVQLHSWFWCARSRCFRVIGGAGGEDGGGAVVALRAVHSIVNVLRVYARLRVGGEWVLQNLLPLPPPPVLENAHGAPPPPPPLWNAKIVAAHETYVLVRPRDGTRLLSVDLKTMAVECVDLMYYEGPAYPYELTWPPTLVDLEAAADNSSDPNTTTVHGHVESTCGFQIPYTELKATQNVARLSFSHGTCVIL